MGGMKKQRSEEERRRLVEEFERSGLTRRAYCAEAGIPMTTLDAWRRVRGERGPLVRVKVAEGEATGSFLVHLANGRRIESKWNFGEAELARLIRLAESA